MKMYKEREDERKVVFVCVRVIRESNQHRHSLFCCGVSERVELVVVPVAPVVVIPPPLSEGTTPRLK
jgi:hypothetical protein